MNKEEINKAMEELEECSKRFTENQKNKSLEERVIDRVNELIGRDVMSCVTLSDAEECYIQGYKDAIQEACEWLKNNLPPAMFRSDLYMFNGEFFEDFKKAMNNEK